ncbi:MAG TPA: HAMP domain-containing sensor histidine kinase [Solirubrobacteraceae bacterium]|nr:HAMP domain-containing sensor histidine kinase [Solirubrobacteraceae bacterium]
MSALLAGAGWAIALPALVGLIVQRVAASRRGRLTARACHELRGPLTALGLALAAMAREAEAPADRLAALEAQHARAVLAVEDLAHARSGRRTPARARALEAGAFLASQAEAWAMAAGDRVVRVAGGDDSPGWLLADRVRLAQAVGNLVANALEHGDGPVVLRARSAGKVIALEVADAGGGLPLPVADLLARAGGGRDPRGHGLAIAAQIAADHGGRLVSRPSTSGARLALELPRLAYAVAPCAQGLPADSIASGEGGSLSGARAPVWEPAPTRAEARLERASHAGGESALRRPPLAGPRRPA